MQKLSNLDDIIKGSHRMPECQSGRPLSRGSESTPNDTDHFIAIVRELTDIDLDYLYDNSLIEDFLPATKEILTEFLAFSSNL